MDSVIFQSVLPFSDGLNLLKQVGVSVIFVLFVLEHFICTRKNVSQKLDMSITRSTVYQKVFSFFIHTSKNLNITPKSPYFSDSAFSNSKKI